MKTATAEKPETEAVSVTRPLENLPCFIATGRDTIAVRAGTTFLMGGQLVPFVDQFEVIIIADLKTRKAGSDYLILMAEDNFPFVALWQPELVGRALGGFHYAPCGNADGRVGGDDIPAINPCSIWDLNFRPAGPDPRGMTYVANVPGSEGVRPFWADIYLLGVDHLHHGTSAVGQVIADGDDLPKTADGEVDSLNYHTAKAIMEQHGKGLMSFAEYAAFAYGGTEKSASGKDPKTTKLDAARTSRCGGMQAFGSMWVWGHDGDPDEPRASIFGGDWDYGSDAGSRYAIVGSWPGDSVGWFSARGRSDHLQLA